MICDPGEVIIEEIRKNGYIVTALPGASAVTTFLAQIPKGGEEFCFIGFIPRGEAQIKTKIQKYAGENLIFYDSPERILKTLKVIQNVRGDVKVALARELSKLFEEVLIDNISNILKHYSTGIKGEIVCMVYAEKEPSAADLDIKIKELKDKGFKDREISVILASLFGFNKNEVYKKSLECK